MKKAVLGTQATGELWPKPMLRPLGRESCWGRGKRAGSYLTIVTPSAEHILMKACGFAFSPHGSQSA